MDRWLIILGLLLATSVGAWGLGWLPYPIGAILLGVAFIARLAWHFTRPSKP